MKYYFILLVLLLFAATVQAQKKPTNKDKPPTEKEMQQMMKQAQGMMDEMMKEMSPEDKKAMDSLGIKTPDFKNASKIISGISNKQLATAWEDENRIVPKKDAARIAAIPKGLTSARMETYIAAIHKKYMETLAPETIDAGQKLYDLFKVKGKKTTEKGLLASLLWISGKPQLGLFLMGRSCIDDAQNTDNLANYAAMLTMQGGQHLAIPILQNLNERFPKNSTLLNNLGQAWFGLGEIEKATLYLDGAMAVYPFHPQANLTKALIQENKGDKKAAVESVKKSIKHAYTQEKEEKLQQLGYKLTRKDIRVPFKPGSDPMGLGKIHRPDYPISVAQAIALYPFWEQFNNEIDKKIKKLEQEISGSAVRYTQYVSDMATQSMAIQNGGAIPTYKLTPIFMKKASLLANQQKAYHEGKLAKLLDLEINFNKDIATIRENHRRAVPEAPCITHLERANELIEKLNKRKKSYDEEVLKFHKQFYNDMAYWAMYTSTDQDMFNMICMEFELSWLKKNRELQPYNLSKDEEQFADCINREEAKPGKLAEFDDIACEYKSTVDAGFIKMETNCNYTTTTYDFNVAKFIEKERGITYIGGTVKLMPELKGGGNIGPVEVEGTLGADVNINLDEKNNVTDWNGTVKAGVEGGIGTKIGPVDVGATVSQTIEMEIGFNGMGDVNTTSAAQVSAGVGGQKISVGSEKRVSLISGHGSRSGTGMLSGITFSSW